MVSFSHLFSQLAVTGPGGLLFIIPKNQLAILLESEDSSIRVSSIRLPDKVLFVLEVLLVEFEVSIVSEPKYVVSVLGD